MHTPPITCRSRSIVHIPRPVPIDIHYETGHNEPYGYGEMYQIKKLKSRHQSIARWLLANPDKTYKDCAAFFKLHPQTISIVVNSDTFQAMMKDLERQAGISSVHTIGNKLHALTSDLLDKAREMVAATPSERFVGDMLDRTLDALGYSAGPAPKQEQHMHLHVDSQVLQEARQLYLQGRAPTPRQIDALAMSQEVVRG